MFYETDIRLINLVKDNPVLYNPNDANYMKLSAREAAWKNIGDELGMLASECKQRWVNIRDAHRRMISKCMRNPDLNIKKYKYDSELAFIIPFHKEKHACLLVTEDDEDVNDGEDGNCETENEQLDDENDDAESDESGKPILKVKRERPESTRAHTRFSKILDLKLLKLVKATPEIYDSHHINHSNFNARQVAWQKIGDEMGIAASDCRNRWINIRDAHRRTIMKRARKPGLKIKKYKYDRELAFMRSFYEENPSKRTKCVEYVDDDEDDNCDETYEEENEELVEDITAAYSDESDKLVIKKERESSEVEQVKQQKKLRKMTWSREEREEEVKSTSKYAAPLVLDPMDPVDAFLINISATLKTFTPYHLNVAKCKIFNVVQQHEMEQIVDRPETTNNSEFVYVESDNNV